MNSHRDDEKTMRKDRNNPVMRHALISDMTFDLINYLILYEVVSQG